MNFALYSIPDNYLLEYNFTCGVQRAFEHKHDYANSENIIVIGLTDSGFYRCEFNEYMKPTSKPKVGKKVINDLIRQIKGMKI